MTKVHNYQICYHFLKFISLHKQNFTETISTFFDQIDSKDNI